MTGQVVGSAASLDLAVSPFASLTWAAGFWWLVLWPVCLGRSVLWPVCLVALSDDGMRSVAGIFQSVHGRGRYRCRYFIVAVD